MIFIMTLIVYFVDCKNIGKENLAVSLSKRILIYLLYIVTPIRFRFNYEALIFKGGWLKKCCKRTFIEIWICTGIPF